MRPFQVQDWAVAYGEVGATVQHYLPLDIGRLKTAASQIVLAFRQELTPLAAEVFCPTSLSFDQTLLAAIHPRDALDQPLGVGQARGGSPELEPLVAVPDVADMTRFVGIDHRVRINEAELAPQ